MCCRIAALQQVAGAFEPCRHLRRYVEPARFKNERHNGKPRQQVVGGRRRRFPKPVMGRQIAVSRAEIGKPRRQQFEMTGLLCRNPDPIVEEVARQALAGKARDDVPAQIDRVELDMGERMKQRDPPGPRAKGAALRHLAGRAQHRPIRPGGPRRRRDIADRQGPFGPDCRQRAARGRLC